MFFHKIEGWLITYIVKQEDDKLHEGYQVSWEVDGFTKLSIPKDAIDIRVRPIGKSHKLK